MARKLRGGIGSNQYQTKPGSGAGSRADADVSPDDVAWAFHPDYVAWSRAGVHTPTEAAEWTSAGYTTDDVADLKHLGWTSAAELAEWQQIVQKPETAMLWKLNVPDLDTAIAWGEAAATARYAAKKIAEGVSINEMTAAWDDVAPRIGMADGLRARIYWISNDVDVDTVEDWHDTGLDARTVGQWVARGIGPEEAARWDEELKADARDWDRWTAAGVTDPTEAAAWVTSYREQHVVYDLNLILEWRETRAASGLGP